MANQLDKWIFSFAITETQRHKNFTTYKITSIIIPKNTPEALSCVTVLKRFREVKQLFKDICFKAREAKIDPIHVPEIKNSTYFKRFAPEIIEERKNYIIKLLNFIGDHPVLFRSEAFVKFFDTSQPQNSPDISRSITESGNEDGLSVETISTDDLMINDEDLLSVQSNNLEAYLGNVQGDILDQVTNKVFPEQLSSNPDTNILIGRLTDDISLDRKLEDIRIDDIERRLKLLVDDNSFDYLYEAALQFTEAVESEAVGFYQKAFDSYKAGIDLLLCGVKNDSDTERKQIVREKVSKYLAKAEDIYENFILKENQDDALVLLTTKSVERGFEEITVNLERPLNYLSRYRIVTIVDGLQQVQDVTDKKVYMMKIIQKPHSLQASRMIYLPQESRYMVPLIAYCQTSTSIFLLLKLISGGKLWDYIKSYQAAKYPVKYRENESYKAIFAEPSTKLGPVHRLLSQLSQEQCPNTKTVINADDINDIHFPSVPGTPEPDSKENIASYETLSPEMEVSDLLNCSQKLLNSISSTLQRSKDTDAISIASTASSLDSEINEGSIGEILKEILQADTVDNAPPKHLSATDNFLTDTKVEGDDVLPRVSPFTLPNIPRVRLLPTTTVRQYCAELVSAIDDLHSKGIVCGDLSLDNILLGDKGQLQLTYFYRNEARLSCPSEKALKCYYVAPERPLNKLSDSWSLGIIMFELLTEQRFFEMHPGSLDYFAELQFDNIEIEDDAQDLLNQLIVVNINNRLTISQVMEHAFFDNSVDWMGIREKGKVQLK